MKVMKVKINVNIMTEVKLTDYGKKILEDYNTRLGFIPIIKERKRFQLWEVMSIFGKSMYNGNPEVPFIDNLIYFNEDDELLSIIEED